MIPLLAHSSAGEPSATEPDRTLALELVRATEAAALSSHHWVGRGQKDAADGAAVTAMRAFLTSVRMDGHIVIGEGEKDGAPMLFNGEAVGNRLGPSCDIAVDPIDGTSLVAAGRAGALSVIAAAGRHAMYDPSAVFYMNKWVTSGAAAGVIDPREPVAGNLSAVARALGTSVSALTVAVLDRPRHAALVQQIRSVGAGVRLLDDGDVAAGVVAAMPGSAIDVCVGIGGTPEGVITACAVKALGGELLGTLAPQSDLERDRALRAGHDLQRVFTHDDLAGEGPTIFVATGITTGILVDGVEQVGGRTRTHSLILRSHTETMRWVTADHAPSPSS